MINFDLEPERPDAELRATLQWIAASELGIPTIYFKKSQESRIEKVPCSVSGWITRQLCTFSLCWKPSGCPFNSYEFGVFNLESFQPKEPCEDFQAPSCGSTYTSLLH